MKDISMQDHIHTGQEAPPITMTALDGKVVSFEKRDPYGHFYISQATGTLPEKYQGAFTTMVMAEQQAKLYIEERNRAYQAISNEISVTPRISKKRNNGSAESNSNREQLREGVLH